MAKKKTSARKQKKPDHRDATLVLRLYDLRREPVMRESRAKIVAWLPKSYEEFLAATQPTDPMNQAFRQVSTYWEMAYGFARHGIVNADLLAENGVEGLLLFTKVEPYLERFRADVSPTAFQNASWLVASSKVAAQRQVLLKKRISAAIAAAK